jgi:integrase
MPSITAALALSNRDCRTLAPGTYRDTKQPGLLYRVGVKRRAFYFLHDTTLNGSRVVTSRLVGRFDPTKFGVTHARKEAAKIAGRVASGRTESKQRFDEAFAEYVAKLKRTRSAKWAEIVEGIGDNHLKPKWKGWHLDKLAKSPKIVRKWHRELSDDVGPTAANHAARVLRATYRYAAKEDTSLPRDRHPCTSVEYNAEHPREVGIEDWKAWRVAWDAIDNPTRKAMHLFALLSGVRPGEGARLRCDAFNVSTRSLTIKKSKNKLDVTIPLSVPIIRALRMARDAHDKKSGFVFQARGAKGHVVRFDSDDLPWYANHLRHTYLSVGGSLGIDELTLDMLTTHQPKGITRKYFVRMIVNAGPALRSAQRQISNRIVTLLGQA